VAGVDLSTHNSAGENDTTRLYTQHPENFLPKNNYLSTFKMRGTTSIFGGAITIFDDFDRS
jgi:hypothetical protein